MSFNKRNLKYGGLSIALTALIVAVVIVVNVAVTSLGSTFSWYTDLTGSAIYSVSDAFGKNLDEIMSVNGDTDDKNDLYINIVLLMEEDSFRDYSAYTYYVYHTLKQVDRDNDHINLVYINSLQYPEYIQEKYMKTSSDSPAITDVIFEIADEEGNSMSDIGYKKYAINSFYMADSETKSVIGYDAETKILSAIAQLAGKVGADTMPVVYFLQGHNEPTLEEAEDWVALYKDAGFAVKTINLVSEDFPEKITKGSLVFINQPKMDLSDNTANGRSEIQKLRSFAATSYGNIIATLDASVPFLPNLDALMSEWGVGMGGSITDDAHSVSGSHGNKVFGDSSELEGFLSAGEEVMNDNKVYADYSLTIGSVAKSVLEKATGTSENRAYTLFTNPRGFWVFPVSKVDYLYQGAAIINVDVLLAPYDTATMNWNTDEPSGATKALATITRIIHNVNYDAETTHYVLCIGSSDFINSALDKTNYNKTLMYQALNLMWSGALTFDDISYKPFDDKSLAVTTEQTNAWMTACVAVIPAVFLVAGTIVWVRRRHS